MPEKSRIRQVKFGLWISIAILVVTAFIVYSRYQKNKASTDIVQHAFETRTLIGRIHALISETESAAWGFLQTGDSALLEGHEARQAELARATNELRAMVNTDVAQSKNAEQLQRLIYARLEVTNNNLRMPATGQNLVRGRIVMRGVLQEINNMKAIEESTISQKIEGMRAASERFTIAVILALLITTVLIAIGSGIVIRGYSSKLVIEKQLLLYQQQLSDKLEKLDISNKELEQFAYVASHDLQEPLRKIITFSERINGKYSANIDPEMRDYLDRISRAADRMRALIEDLLAYSKAAKSIPDRAPVKLDNVFNIIKDNLEVKIQSRGVKFMQYGEMPEVYGDKTQMVQLFQNLVSNAIKFTDPAKSPVIEVSSELVPRDELEKEVINPKYSEYYRVALKDNGIGFDEKYLDRIFITFQRLHGRSEYEGAGIGLSICKKIAEKHDGYITAKSQPGKGSVFFVFLPKVHEQRVNSN